MKEQFIEKRFCTKNQRLLEHISGTIDKYTADEYDLSSRQICYQLLTKNIITGSEFDNTETLISNARLAGLIDWAAIKDRSRAMVQNPHWDTPRDILASSSQQFKIDKWATQPNYLEVMVEKQALEGVLIPVCKKLDIPFTANKGYPSSSTLYEASKRYLARLNEGKALFVIYLGDHDPSGIDMTRDISERLSMFIRSKDGIYVDRIALNMAQITKLKLPPNPAKMTDTRANGYIKKFGSSSWELDAIEPRELAKLVTDKVLELRDEKLWTIEVKREQQMIKELKRFADTSKFR